ncbi:hypothetical protein CC86DRAFT_370068 [Ophiobolus disseminans]|uniref:Uncharacterized protein n=1 Tax=Ophiobolus disseminans TaxID=1469910 RepID=A0A6A7A0W4_9PLEO|nr:hypothetical protein CC86DRAFT_370068 [Ophiobolus disseminans]
MTTYEPEPYASVYAADKDKDWTGDTLATICPTSCNPFYPQFNMCDITTSCTTTGSAHYYCACRAG